MRARGETAAARLGLIGVAVLLTAMLAGCGSGALHPTGRGATDTADLFGIMAIGATLIWVLVIGLAIYGARARPVQDPEGLSRWLIVGGGIAFPAVVLGGLLTYALTMMADLRAPADGGLRISVTGEQWWWRVRYWSEGAERPVESANEVRLPAGRRVELELASADVIHSFWIAPLGGKVDMIPGRINRLVLEPTETGTFRGVCAEYCGTSHALMAFGVQVMEPDAFEAWLQREAETAAEPEQKTASAGRDAFLAAGCGACHTVRGTPATGVIGPDLTHVGRRLTLAAGILPNDVDAFVRWIAAAEEVKPGARMPAFGALGHEDLNAIAVYLESLQ